MLLDGRVCVVAGVGPGLGRQIAVLAARHGADLVLASRREAVLKEVAGDVESLGRRALVVPTDMTDREQCRRLADATLEAYGRVDTLVNNAYTEDAFKSFRKVDLDDWRRIVDVNVFGPLQVTQSFTPAMVEQQAGSIVFVNSMIVRKQPSHPEGGYAVSKGALFTAARVLASELARYRIRVNSVLPGWMWGPQVEAFVRWQAERRNVPEEEIVAEITRDIPLGTIPTDAEVAGAVVFLASDLAAAVTGQAIDANGGEVFA